MKKILSIICLVTMFALCSRAQIGVYTATNVLYNPAMAAGTNSSVVYAASGNLRIVKPFFQFANGGLATTNALYWRIKVGVGNTNSWCVVTNYYHAATNYTTDIPSIDLTALPIYIQIDAVNTNTVNASATIGHN